MNFTYDGRPYKLTFERRRRHVTVMRKGHAVTINSTYPYTTVTLHERLRDGVWKIVGYATVGCLPTDFYSNANGRLFALRALNEQLKRANYPKEFREAVWQAYITRDKKPVARAASTEPVIDTTATRVPLALPPAPPSVAELNKLDERTIH